VTFPISGRALSLREAEYCESEAAIRRLESHLWETGVRILQPRVQATRYQAARARDPDFYTLIDDYTQLAKRYRQLREMELATGGSYRESWTCVRKLRWIEAEYQRIRAEERAKKL